MRATYASAYTPQDVSANAALAGSFEWAFGTDGRYTMSKNGQRVVDGTFDVQFDEVLLTRETGTGACPNPGKYRWTTNPANGNLALGLLSDDCASRVAYLTRRALTKK